MSKAFTDDDDNGDDDDDDLLISDMGSYTRGSCKFPDFLIRHQQWRDMTGRYRLELDDGLQVIRVKNRHRTDVITYTGNLLLIQLNPLQNDKDFDTPKKKRPFENIVRIAENGGNKHFWFSQNAFYHMKTKFSVFSDI